MRRKSLFAVAAMIMAFSIAPAFAAKDSASINRDIKFSNLLNKEKLYDYSELFLKDRIAGNPAEADRLKIQLADTYVQMNKPVLANKLITSIPTSSKYYYSGQFTLGKVSLEKGKFEQGMKFLWIYVKHFHGKLQKNNEDLMQEYRTAVSYLSWAYKQKGNTKKAEEVIKKYMPTESDREAILYGLLAKLDAAETLKKQEGFGRKKNTAWRKIVEKILPEFVELRWAGPDAITLYSIVGSGRALFMLEKYNEAIKELSGMPEVFNAFEKEFKKMGDPGQSPSAGARFWLACSFAKLAEFEKDKKSKIKYYAKAMKQYLIILKRLKGYPKAAEVYSNLIICQKALGKMGKKVTIKDLEELKPANAGKTQKLASIMPPDAKKYIEEKKYSQAIPPLLNSVRKNRQNPAVAEVLSKLGIAYAGTNQALEALAIADYVGSVFPESNGVPISILQIGQIFWKAKKVNDAIRAYELYLDIAPSHEYGARIAMLVAKEYYDRATALAKMTNKLQGAAKQKMKDKAIAAYKLSIPKYQRIINNYGSDPKIVGIAYYLLGISYSSAEEYAKAAKIFNESTKNIKSPTKLANSKLNAADNYFKGGNHAKKIAQRIREEAYALGKSDLKTKKLADADKLEKDSKIYFKDAVANLNELLDKWMVSGGKIGKPRGAKLKKAAETAQILVAWAYDSADEKKKSISAFQQFIAKYPKSAKVPSGMSRIGILYYELNDYATSAKVLERLAEKYPTSKEAKSAYYNLGRNMYEIGNYAKAFEVFNRIFNQKIEVSNSNLRWMASNLVNCGEKHPKEGALLSLVASKTLLLKLKTADKDLSSWVGDKTAAKIKNDKKAQEKTLDMIQQKILFDAGNAAFYAGDTSKAIAYLDDLLKSKDTPYYYKAKFARADAHIKLKDYSKARTDLSEISLTAQNAKRDSFATKAKLLLAITYMDENDYMKPFASLNLIAKGLEVGTTLGNMLPPGLSEKAKVKLIKERQEEVHWVEEAVYLAAVCAGKLGKNEDSKRLAKLYKKNFPKGRFIEKIDKLPAPVPADKK